MQQRPSSPKGSRRQGKITQTAITPKLVARRARELARINGRDRANKDDIEQARRELSGAIHPTRTDRTVQTTPWDPTPSDTGTQAEKMLPQDDQQRKELVEEGVDEAEHDQMRQTARPLRDQRKRAA